MKKAERVITNKKEAWELIHQLGTAKVKAENIDLKFRNFPKLEITYSGDQFRGSLPYRTFDALKEVQDDVYRAYALAKYNDERKLLSKKERDSLEIVVNIKPGSSLVEVGLGEQAEKIMLEALSKMEPQHVIVVVALFAIAYAAPKIVKQFQETRRKEIDNKRDIDLSEQETKRLGDLTKVIESQTEQTRLFVDTIFKNAESTTSRLARVVRTDDTVKIADFEVMDRAEVKEEFKTSREKKPDIQIINQEFMVKKIAWKNDYLTRVVTLEFEGKELGAEFPNEKNEIVNALYEASKKKTPIRLKVEGLPSKTNLLSGAIVLDLV
jgi:hypothetical protein